MILLVHNHLLLFLVLHVFETTSYVWYENAMIVVLVLLQLNIVHDFPIKLSKRQLNYLCLNLLPYNKRQKIMCQAPNDSKILLYRNLLAAFEDNMK